LHHGVAAAGALAAARLLLVLLLAGIDPAARAEGG